MFIIQNQVVRMELSGRTAFLRSWVQSSVLKGSKGETSKMMAASLKAIPGYDSSHSCSSQKNDTGESKQVHSWPWARVKHCLKTKNI